MSKRRARRAAYLERTAGWPFAGHRMRRRRHLQMKSATFIMRHHYGNFARDLFQDRIDPLIAAFEAAPDLDSRAIFRVGTR